MTYRPVQCPSCGGHFDLTADVLGTLTKRQAELLRYLETYNGEHGYMPTFEDICAAFHFTSLATVHEHLSNLERKGYITRGFNAARSSVITPRTEEAK